MCKVQSSILTVLKAHNKKKRGITFDKIKESVKLPYYDVMNALNKLEKSRKVMHVGNLPDSKSGGKHFAYYKLAQG